MRDLVTVIDRMIGAIPSTETDLIKGLEKVKSDSRYSAPEAKYIYWDAVNCILCNNVYNTDGEELIGWREEVRKIFVGEI